jgi:hypothetical protein
MDFKCEVPLFSRQRLGNEMVKIGLESNGSRSSFYEHKRGNDFRREISVTATAPVSLGINPGWMLGLQRGRESGSSSYIISSTHLLVVLSLALVFSRFCVRRHPQSCPKSFSFLFFSLSLTYYSRVVHALILDAPVV